MVEVPVLETKVSNPENAAIGARLELALTDRLGPRYVVKAAKIADCSTNTIRRMVAGSMAIDARRVARLATFLGFSLTEVLTGTSEPILSQSQAQSQSQAAVVDTVEIPILNAAASAGAGLIPEGEPEETGTMTFPRAWARAFGTIDRLRLIEIVGDSMRPDLAEGDWMLINLDLVELRDGIALVRLDDALMVKRLQTQGRRVLLTSSNPAYDPIPVDLQADAERFAVIGRARWAGKALA